MRTRAEVNRVLSLSAAGKNNCEIARLTGDPRATVSQWVRGRMPRFGEMRSRGGCCARCGPGGQALPELLVYSYAYLLGLYLGDGCLLRHPRGVFCLHIALDAAHPVIASEGQAAAALVMPSSKATVRRDPHCRMLHLVSHSTH